jgi:hypothetical protein
MAMIETFFKGNTIELTSDTDFDDLDQASTIEFIIVKPSGKIERWTATQVGSTQDIQYTTNLDEDLDEIGVYVFQSHIVWNYDDSELHGEIKTFRVIDHL